MKMSFSHVIDTVASPSQPSCKFIVYVHLLLAAVTAIHNVMASQNLDEWNKYQESMSTNLEYCSATNTCT